MRNVEDIYPLSHTQLGLLFHSLYAQESDLYVQQLHCVLEGPLNFEAFEQAWNQVIGFHSILRTAFVWEQLDEPLQVVREKVRLPFEQMDWRDLNEDAQQQHLNAFL